MSGNVEAFGHEETRPVPVKCSPADLRVLSPAVLALGLGTDLPLTSGLARRKILPTAPSPTEAICLPLTPGIKSMVPTRSSFELVTRGGAKRGWPGDGGGHF